MAYLEPLQEAANLLNTISLHRDDAVRAAERLKYQGGQSGNGVDFSNLQASMRAIKTAADQVSALVTTAQDASINHHDSADGQKGSVHRLTPRVVATGTPPITDYPDGVA